MSINDRLQLLKRSELGWSAFHVDFQTTLRIPHEPFGIYDLTGGIYLMGDVSQKALHYCTLPSNPGDSITWSRIDLHKSLTVVDIGLCLYEHDLVAVVTTKTIPTNTFLIDVEVHLLQFSTGKPHPLAREPVLFVRKAHGPTAAGVGIEIVGDYLALITTPSSTELAARFCVFAWKTGNIVLDHPVPHNTYCSLVFLSPTHICLPNATTGTLDIYDIAPSKPTDSAPVFFFSLPTVSAGYGIRAIYGRSELNLAPNGVRHSPLPFHPAPEDAIAIFNVHIRHDGGGGIWGDFSMFVHRSSLLQWCEARLADGQSLEWEAWGPLLTRWIDVASVPWWITTTTGQRCVLSSTPEARETGDPPYVTIMDFNPMAVKRTISAYGGDQSMNDVVEGRPTVHIATTWTHSIVFESSVESTLPYVTISRSSIDGAPFNFDGVLMDEERLLGLVVCLRPVQFQRNTEH
ncbi:hypothetical protein H0H87_005597 [Tephrocybe sp. NHM501043]|nr:hypothetical protein H0H87_005597 [Tephrocybe sp. NHM501043]